MTCPDCKKYEVSCPGTPTGKIPGYCFKMQGRSPQAAPEAVSAELALLYYPWDSLETEGDGMWSNYAAWQKWMDAKHEAVLDDIPADQLPLIYSTMCELAG